jgi:hypothetical protein
MPIDHAHQECWTCLFNTNSNEPLHIPGLQIEPVHPENWGSYTEDGMHPSFGSLEVQCRKTIVKRNLKQKINGLYTRICKLFKKEEK